VTTIRPEVPRALVELLFRARLGRALVVAAVATWLTGCAASVRSAAVELPRAAVPVVVDESLRSLEAVENLERLDRILGSPQMQRAIRDAGASATRGAFTGAAEERAMM
jgi:hypothetical protein